MKLVLECGTIGIYNGPFAEIVIYTATISSISIRPFPPAFHEPSTSRCNICAMVIVHLLKIGYLGFVASIASLRRSGSKDDKQLIVFVQYHTYSVARLAIFFIVSCICFIVL